MYTNPLSSFFLFWEYIKEGQQNRGKSYTLYITWHLTHAPCMLWEWLQYKSNMARHVCFGKTYGMRTSQKMAIPQLYSFAKEKHVTVHEARRMEHFHNCFHLPLSEEAYNQFVLLKYTSTRLDLHESHDTWTYIWGSGSFS